MTEKFLREINFFLMIKAAIEDCQELRVTTTFNPSNCGIFWIPEFLKKTSKICPKEALEGPTSGGPKVIHYYVIQYLKCSQSLEKSKSHIVISKYFDQF